MTSVLLVDDERAILDSFEKFFSNEGYTTFTANNAKGALEVLKNQKIDLAILDILMPDVSGLDLALKIRRNPATKNLKIIFATVLDAPRDGEADLIPIIKPEAWLQKPVEVFELREAVKKAFGGD